MRHKTLATSLCLILTILLSACGTLSISIELTPTIILTRGQPTAQATPQPTFTPASQLVQTQQAIPSQSPPQTSLPQPEEFSHSHLGLGLALQILQVRMLDAQSGWALGQAQGDLFDRLFFTQDGGVTWQDRTPLAALEGAPADGLAAAAYFASAQEAWVAYTGRAYSPRAGKQLVWYTRDGGRTWQAGQPLDLSSVPQEFYNPSDLGFLDGEHGWMLAHLGVGMSHDYIAAFTTSDGGGSWVKVIDPDKNPELMVCQKTGLAFGSPDNGWLVGDCPGLMPFVFIYHTLDGGDSWQQVTLPTPPGQPGDLFSAGSRGCGILLLAYVQGENVSLNLRCTDYNSGASAAWLYTSSDGGKSWTPRPLPLPYGVFDFLGPQEGWYLAGALPGQAGAGELYHTTDGGASWSVAVRTGWQGQPDFIDAQSGWVVARNGEDTALVHTSDGGGSWKQVSPFSAP